MTLIGIEQCPSFIQKHNFLNSFVPRAFVVKGVNANIYLCYIVLCQLIQSRGQRKGTLGENGSIGLPGVMSLETFLSVWCGKVQPTVRVSHATFRQVVLGYVKQAEQAGKQEFLNAFCFSF